MRQKVVTEIGESAFEECDKLATIALPEGVTDLGNFAFSGCTALSSVILPSTLESLGRYAFDECEAMTNVTCYAQTPPSLRSNTFAIYGTLHVLKGCKATYETANYWKNFIIVEDAEDPNLYKFSDGTIYNKNNDEKIGLFRYIRTFSNTTWQALYVPFSIPVDTLTKYGMEVAELNDTHMYDNDEDGVFEKVTIEFLKLVEGTTEANCPYLIRALETGEKMITMNNVELKTAAETSIDCSTTKQLFTFTGTYSGIDGATMHDNHYYAISGGKLMQAIDSSVGLKPQRWYMKIENRDGSPMKYDAPGSKAPAIRIIVNGEQIEEFEETATSVECVSEESGNDDYFTLDGQQIRKISRPGLYIKNGKKVIFK